MLNLNPAPSLPTVYADEGLTSAFPHTGESPADFVLQIEAHISSDELQSGLDEDLNIEVSVGPNEPVPAVESVVSAEQLILMVMGQQQTEVKARETDHSDSDLLPRDEHAAMVPAQTLFPGLAASARAVSASPNEGMIAQSHFAAVRVEQAVGSVQPLAVLPENLVAADASAGVAGQKHVGADEVTASVSTPSAVGGEGILVSNEGVSTAAHSIVDSARPASSPSTIQFDPANKMEAQIKLQAPESKWGEQMLTALRDSVELQMQQKSQTATIRLDPPELGSLEILLSHDSGRLNVQISAAQGDVARLLQQTSDRLRQELVGQNFLQVNVQVGSDTQSGQQGRHGHQRGPWGAPQDDLVDAAMPLQGSTSMRSQAASRDVLITV